MPPKTPAKTPRMPRGSKTPRSAKSKTAPPVKEENAEGSSLTVYDYEDDATIKEEQDDDDAFDPSMFFKEKEKEDDSDVEVLDAAPPGPIRTPKQKAQLEAKAARAREVALQNRVATVKELIGNAVEKDDDVVVNCYLHAEEKTAQMDKSFDYTHLMKLVSPMPFVVVKQAMLTSGPYTGHVALLIKQSNPFPFMKLPPLIRGMIYTLLLKHTTPNEAIPITLRQSGKKTAHSAPYKAPHKLALLSVCKAVLTEAAPLVYAQKFHFPGTQVISMFLVQIGQFRAHLRHLRCDTYNSASARTSFQLLQDARALRRIYFAHVSSNQGPATALANVFNDAHAFLLAVDREDPMKGLKVIRFDKAAFHRREKGEDGKACVVKWGEGEWAVFWEGLLAKLRKAAAQH